MDCDQDRQTSIFVSLLLSITTDFAYSRSILQQTHTWGHLLISYEGFMMMIREFGIFPPLLDLIRSFRVRIDEIGENCIGCRFRTLQTQTGRDRTIKSDILLTISEICFDLRYPALHGRDDCTPAWSIRHMGVYHKYDIGTEKLRWIFIQPSESIRNRIEKLAHHENEFDRLLAPFLLVVFSTERKWGEYLQYLEDRFKEVVNTTFLSEYYEQLANQNVGAKSFILEDR